MKTTTHFYDRNLLLIFILLAGSLPSFGQDSLELAPTVSIASIEDGLVAYAIDGASDDAYIFTLYGDGTFGTLDIPEHHYEGGGDYTSTFYVVEPHEPILPSSIVSGPTVAIGAVEEPVDNPEVAMDGEIDILTSWAPATDQQNFFIIAFKNESNLAPVSGQLVLHYLEEETTITGGIIGREDWVGEASFGTSELAVYSHKLSWNFSGLAYNETRYVYVPATVDLEIGAYAKLRAEYSTVGAIGVGGKGGKGGAGGEFRHTDNIFSVHGDPHDPNFKTVNRACIHPDDPGQRLEYTIGFFNDGENFAHNVVVTDKLSAWLNASTIAIIDAEYDYSFEVIGDELTILFPDIYLPGTNQTSPKAYSYEDAFTHVTFSICTNGPLPYDSCIYNEATIVFDSFEEFITTPAIVCSGQPCTEIIEACVSPPRFRRSSGLLETPAVVLSAFPNPTSDELNIQIGEEAINQGLLDLEILDCTGKIVKRLWQSTAGETTLQQQFTIGDLVPGLYLLTLRTTDRVYTQKLVKQ